MWITRFAVLAHTHTEQVIRSLLFFGVIRVIFVDRFNAEGYNNSTFNNKEENVKSRDLIKMIEKRGWVQEPNKNGGSHRKFKHPDFKYHITIQHPDDLGKGLVCKIKKQAGL